MVLLFSRTFCVPSVKGSSLIENAFLRPSYTMRGVKICGAVTSCSCLIISMVAFVGSFCSDGSMTETSR